MNPNPGVEVAYDTRMTIAEQVLEKLRTLPPEEQQRVLDFVGSLKENNANESPRRSLRGLWSDLPIHLTEEDIATVRREMWDNFPREIR